MAAEPRSLCLFNSCLLLSVICCPHIQPVICANDRFLPISTFSHADCSGGLRRLSAGVLQPGKAPREALQHAGS